MENKNSLLEYKKILNEILIGLDIGGTLTKIAIVNHKNETKLEKLFESYTNMNKIETGDFLLHLLFFSTSDFETEVMTFLKKLNEISEIKQINATGGGAYKYEPIIRKSLNTEFIKHDELISLVDGYIFINDYGFIYKIKNFNERIEVPSLDLEYPHISVNIGSGVSILKVSSPLPKDIQRVAGTIMGGGTLIGLSKLLIGIDDYNEIINLAQKGNYHNIDLSNEDIYGKDSKKNSNEPEIPISSFGKVYHYVSDNKKSYQKEDIALSLLNMICLHITQIASLVAKKYNINNIYFYGNFTRSSFAISLLNKATLTWNKNLEVRFNILDGFLGAVGTLVEKNKKNK